MNHEDAKNFVLEQCEHVARCAYCGINRVRLYRFLPLSASGRPGNLIVCNRHLGSPELLMQWAPCYVDSSMFPVELDAVNFRWSIFGAEATFWTLPDADRSVGSLCFFSTGEWHRREDEHDTFYSTAL